MKLKWITPSAAMIGISLLLTGNWPGNSYRTSAFQGQDGGGATPALRPVAQPSPEEKDVFVDEDLKEEKVRGEWAIASKPDSAQIDDPSTPAVVKAVATYTGQGKYRGLAKIRKAQVENRSAKPINSLRLRWFIVSVEAPTPILLEGVTPLFEASLHPYGTKVVDIPHIFLTRVIKPLRKSDELSGIFYIVLGVQEVRFADGSAWKRSENISLLKVSYLTEGQLASFPTIEKALLTEPLLPPPQRLTLAACKVQARFSPSAFFLPHTDHRPTLRRLCRLFCQWRWHANLSPSAAGRRLRPFRL